MFMIFRYRLAAEGGKTEVTKSEETGFPINNCRLHQSSVRTHQQCTRYFSPDCEIVVKCDKMMENGEAAVDVPAASSDVEEDDPGRLLNAWLGELDNLKKVSVDGLLATKKHSGLLLEGARKM